MAEQKKQIYMTDTSALQETEKEPESIIKKGSGHYFIDFGKAAFGTVKLTLRSDKPERIFVHLGEDRNADNTVNKSPEGNVCYRKIPLDTGVGEETYRIIIPPDKKNTGERTIKMPSYIGEVLPFRYCELKGPSRTVNDSFQIKQVRVHYPFNDQASEFESSHAVLDDVWDLCKYTIKATSFCGIYVDGNRERFPREADSFINQLGHYNVDSEYALARYTNEFMMTHTSKWTEWILHSIPAAWYDYMYTGDAAFLEKYYEDLKAKTLISLAADNGLISTRTGLLTDEIRKSIHHYEGEHVRGKQLQDIVDWPHPGVLGLKNGEGGETDGFDFRPYNTVVNAFHFRALVLMGRIAGRLKKDDDRHFFERRARRVKASFNENFFNKKKGVYVDGEASAHSSLHANMFPLAFGLVPDGDRGSVIDFIKSRDMACSVYGAHYLLEALYSAEEEDYAFQLLTATGERSWGHMIYDTGTTITMESWDEKFKPNLDWNHAWGAAPANIIPRRLMGVRPAGPGFQKILIQPQPGPLKSASLKLPTVRGPVHVYYRRNSNCYELEMLIPKDTVARIVIPLSKASDFTLDDSEKKAEIRDEKVIFDPVDSGHHKLTYRK